MKTAIFTLAALFGLGLGLLVVGVDFGRVILGSLIASTAIATLLWTGTTTLRQWRTTLRSTPDPGKTARTTRALLAIPRRLIAPLARHASRLPLSPLLSVLMGLSLGAALAKGSADLPAALLCGALAGALHLLAFTPPAPATPAPQPPRIAPVTEAHLTRLIATLAPCRDPHLHRAARALRRTATTLAAQADAAPTQMPAAQRALTLWLPALTDAAEHLRQHHLTPADPALLHDQTAALTETLARVTAHLASLAPECAPEGAPERTLEPAPPSTPRAMAQPAH